MKKKFDISLFYSDDYNEFDKCVEAKLKYINLKLDRPLRYARDNEFVSIGNEFYTHAFRTSTEVQCFLDGIQAGLMFKN